MEYYKNLDLADIKYFCEFDQIEKTELWRPVNIHKGYYEVSDLGRVKSKERYVNHSTCGKQLVSEKILRSTTGKIPYRKVYLSKDNLRTTIKVHRLVAMAFIPNPENKRVVNHKDGVKDNNVVSNLEWSTSKENNQHAHDTGLISIPKGSNCSLSKLTDEQVLEIRRSSKITGHKFLSEKFNVSMTVISYVVNRKTYTNI